MRVYLWNSQPPALEELLPEAKCYHQQYLYKVPNGYYGTGVSCPVDAVVAAAALRLVRAAIVLTSDEGGMSRLCGKPCEWFLLSG